MFVEVPEESTLGEDAADWYRRQREAWGYLPNYSLAFASHPDVAVAWDGLIKAVGRRMDRRRFELVTIAASRAYRSTYCTAAHCKFLRDTCGDEPTMRAVAADPAGADLDPTDRAVMEYAALVAHDAASVTAADVQALRDVGLTDVEIVDVALASAARAFFTKTLDALGVQADAQLGDLFDPEVRRQVTVGRPIAEAATRSGGET
jgi:uncharacterized peroxidase-related enzyme